MTKSSLFIPLLLLSFIVKGQNLDFNWVNAIGEGIGQDDESRVVVSLPGGKVLVGGVFDEAVDFDPSSGEYVLSTRNSTTDIYFAQYDTTGKLFWVRQLQCTDVCQLTDIAIDASNNIIVTGHFKGTIDFDPGLNPNYYTSKAGSQSGFVAKFNESGILQWAHAIDGPGNDRTNGVATTASNDIIITGAMADSLDADLSAGRKMIHSKGNDDAFLIKYDSTGVHKWSFTIGFGSFDEGKDVEINTKGDICLVGEFRGTPDFDPSSNTYSMKTAGNADIFLASYTNQGAFNWAKRFGGTDEEWVNKLNISAKGKWLLAGSFKGTTNFETGTGNKNVASAGNWDLYIAQYADNGDFEWATAAGNTRDDQTFDLTSDANGNVYATGYFRSNVDFDMSANTLQLSSTRDEIFVAAYDSNGTILWANQLGGIRFDQGYAITTTANNGLLCGGIFREKADFDPGLGTKEFTTPSNVNTSAYVGHYNASNGAYRNAWALEDRNGGSDRIDDLAHDSNGDIVTTGLFSGTVDFDPSSQVQSLTSKGSFDAFLAKYDTLGNCKWTIDIGGNNQDFGEALAIDANNNIFLIGYFRDSIDLDPSANNYYVKAGGNTDVFLAKYSSSGSFLWGFALGSTGADAGLDVAVNSKNQVIISGFISGTVDFDPSANTKNLTAQALDAFIAKYSANGQLLFANLITGADNNTGETITIGSNDEIYLSGNFTKTADFDPSVNTANLTTAGQQNVFVAKYDSLGLYQWAKYFPSNGSNAVYDISLGANEQLYVAGAFQNTTDFDPGTSTVNRKSAGADDGFVVKLDSAGNFKWVNSFGSGNNNVDQAHTVHVAKNRVYVAGGFGGSVDFDPSSNDSVLTAQYSNDIFLVSYDTSGTFIAARQVKGEGYGRAISQYATGVYLGGNFRASADFNPSPTREQIENAGGLDDMFILKLAGKLKCTAPSDSMSFTVCGPYFSRRGKFYHESGRYIDSIYSKDGCDSVFITNLTLLKSDTTIIANVCDSFVSPQGKVFKKSGTYIDTFTNILGCDSLVTLQVSILSTDSTLDTTHCGPFTSFSGKYVYHVSGTYLDTIANAANCDSVITINLIVLNAFDSVSIIETCDSFRTPLSNQLVTQTGVYYDSLKTVEGCDSVFTWNITIHNTGDYFDTLTVCDSFVSPLGITYTQSGIYIDSMQSSNGCDSVITSVVTINKSSFSTLKTSSCQQFVSYSGRDTFYTSGTYQDTIINGSGCDSIITIELEILEPTDTQYVVTVCDSFVSPAGRILKNSGKISDTLSNANGCDSIISIDVTVNYSAQNSISLSECSPIKSPSGKFDLAATGVYYDTLQTQNGCDSIITINFTLKANASSFSVNGKTLTADSVGGIFTYQWLICSGNGYNTISGATAQQYVATESGNYALALSRDNCWDTSACKFVEVGAIEIPNEQITVFPNPTEGFVQITASSKIGNVSVYSSNLKLMNCQMDLIGEKSVVYLAELPKGVYILKVQTEKGMATSLVAKN